MAHLGLPDPMDSAEALLDPVRVPGQVVVDHQVAALEVHPLAGRIVGDEHQQAAVGHEALDDLAALLALHPSVNFGDSLRVPETRPNLAHQVVERVLGLGEDDELPAVAGGVDHQRVVEDPVELRPLRIPAGMQHAERHRLQAPEGRDLQAELLGGLGRGGAGCDSVLEVLDLVLSVFLEVVRSVVVHPHGAEATLHAPDGEPRLGKLLFEPLAPPFEGLVDRGRRGGEPALQDLQGEADVVPPPAIGLREAADPVHLGPNVVGDGGVQGRLVGRQLVLRGIGPPLRKQGPRVEAKQLLLREAAHHVGGVRVVDAVAEAAFEAVAVEQRHEELEVLLLAVVGRRGHEEEVAAALPEPLADSIAPGVADLAAEPGGRHAVGLVADDEIPLRGLHELLLKLLVAGEHVQPRDHAVAVVEGVAGTRRLDHVPGEDVELQAELLAKLVLPLLDEAPGRHDEAAFQVRTRDQLLDQQSRHDRLARPRIVGEQEAQRLARQHLAVDGGDLVGQRIDAAGVDGEIGVEVVRKRDAVRLGD